MLALLGLFLKTLLLILLVSAVSGLIAFFIDIFRFKSEKQICLPRRKLIQKLLDEQELKEAPADIAESEVKENENY